MKSFSLKRMMQFSKLQLNELFLNKTAAEAIKFLLLHSFSITFICLAMKRNDGIKECISLIELLSLLFSYYFSFLNLFGDLVAKKGLLNKISVPATLSEKQASLYYSTLLMGTMILIPSIIISNIILQAAIPFVFGDEVNGLHLIFGGGGKGIKMNLIAAILILYLIILTPLALLYRKYKKVYFWSMFIAFILSYMLPIIFMYGLITTITMVLVTVFWSIFAIITVNKGLRKVELE